MEYHPRIRTMSRMRHSPRFSMWLKLRSVQKISPRRALLFAFKIFFLLTRGKSDSHCVQKRLLELSSTTAYFFFSRLQGFLIGGKTTMLCIAYASRDSRGVVSNLDYAELTHIYLLSPSVR